MLRGTHRPTRIPQEAFWRIQTAVFLKVLYGPCSKNVQLLKMLLNLLTSATLELSYLKG